jgi:hypothetical protein
LWLVKLGNGQLVEKLTRSVIYIDYAHAVCDTTGMPIALRKSLAHFNRIFRKIVSQLPNTHRHSSNH